MQKEPGDYKNEFINIKIHVFKLNTFLIAIKNKSNKINMNKSKTINGRAEACKINEYIGKKFMCSN